MLRTERNEMMLKINQVLVLSHMPPSIRKRVPQFGGRDERTRRKVKYVTVPNFGSP